MIINVNDFIKTQIFLLLQILFYNLSELLTFYLIFY